MSIFVGNTFTKVEDVRSKYREIKTHDLDDIVSGDEVLDGDMICVSDFEDRIREIENDVNKIIKLLKSYNTSEAIDELEILVEKLY